MTTLLAVYRFSLQSPGPEGWSLTKSYPGLPLHLQRVSKPPPFMAHCTVPILTLSCLDPMWRKPFYSFCPSFHFPFTTFGFFLALLRGEWGLFPFRLCQRQPGGPRQRVEAQRQNLHVPCRLTW